MKPNIGHTEGASGLTGVIKAVLALENDTIPPNIHFSTPNPKSKPFATDPSGILSHLSYSSDTLRLIVPFEKAKLQVPVEPTPWPQDRHARVGINCFGIGGANAHVSILYRVLAFSIFCYALMV